MNKRIIYILLLYLPLAGWGQDTTKMIYNPIEERFDYISNLYPGSDTLINIGTNNTFAPDSANGVIGHNNTVSTGNGISVGYSNTLSHNCGYQFGAYLTSGSDKTVTIGRGWNIFEPLINEAWGTVGIGYLSTRPTLYVHSGYQPGETYIGDIGGVSIGGPGLDTLTRLQLRAHGADGSTFLLKGYNSTGSQVFNLMDDGDMTTSGTLTADSIVCETVPTIHTAAGDTSNYNTPDKIGDLFIDTSTGDSYMSTGTSRGDWVKLNGFIPFLLAFRRRWLFTLLIVSAVAYGQEGEQGRIVLNPLTGEPEYISNYYWMQDTLINYGKGNTLMDGRLNGVLGHSNRAQVNDGIVLGNYNSTGCDRNWILGEYRTCFAEDAIQIGIGHVRTSNSDLPGSVGFSAYSKSPIMYVHHGHYTEDPRRGNIGGVSIGKAYDYNASITTVRSVDTTFEHLVYKYDKIYEEIQPFTLDIYGLEGGDLIKGTDSASLENFSIANNGDVSAGVVSSEDFTNQHTPNVYYSAGDTTLFPTPWKRGDFYIDTQDKNVYVAKGTNRGDWIVIGE